MMPQRIRLSRRPGFRLPAGAVAVVRGTPWGNPFRIGEAVDMKQARRWGWSLAPKDRLVVCADAAEACRRFAHCLLWDEAFHPTLRLQLGARDLACWCPFDAPCHADSLLTLANSRPEEIRAIHDAITSRLLDAAARALKGGADG